MTKKQERILKKLHAAFEGVKIKHASRDGVPSHALMKRARIGNTEGYVGWIQHAGRFADGTYQVQFNDILGNGWSSRWPEWAYEEAKAALGFRLRVWVIATGEPYGPNLLSVLILNQAP